MYLSISKVEVNNYSMLQLLKSLVDNKKYTNLIIEVQYNFLHNIQKLKDKFNRYFPEYNGLELMGIRNMIRTPFIVKVNVLPDDIQKDVIELQNDQNCKDTFELGMNIEEFWCTKCIAYLNL